MRTTVLLLLGLLLALMSCRGPTAPALHPEVRPIALPSKSATTRAPLSLTASDGTGLSLTALSARGVVDDPLAFTELTLTFDNPRDEVMEGRFEIRLPPEARITRFAMEITGQWQEAEVVEKQQARQTYESFLHQQRDPALLEQDIGNRFRARVFPIEPRARKRLRLSYTQPLTEPDEPYRVRTRGLPQLEQLDLEVSLVDPDGGPPKVVTRNEQWVTPSDDLVIMRRASSELAVRHGDRLIARVEPLAGVEPGELEPGELEPGEPEPLSALTVLVDTSASRSLELPGDVDRLAALLAAVARTDPAMPLRIMAFDQQVVPMFEGPVEDFGESERAALLARKALGASDLGRALAALRHGEHPRVLLVSDGLASAGKQSPAALRTLLSGLASRGVRRLDALAVGGVRDEPRLTQLVTGPLAASGVVLRPHESPERSVERLRRPTFDRVQISVPGASWWSPRSVDGLQPGDRVMLYAALPSSEPLRLEISEHPAASRELEVRTSTSPLVERTWFAAKITEQIERLRALEDAQESAALRQQIIARSVEHRIVNDLTALLVLETEQDYARFGLERRALSNILEVREHDVELVDRRQPDWLANTRRSHVADPTQVPVPIESTVARDGSEPITGNTSAESRVTVTPSSRSAATSVGRTISMEEFRNIPVGSSVSRDFTQVVTVEPTASYDTQGVSIQDPGNEFRRPPIDLNGPSGAPFAPPLTDTEPRPAEVRVHRVRVRGGTLTEDRARTYASDHRDPLEACYGRALERATYLRGRLTLELTLDAEGHVVRVAPTGGRLATLGKASVLRSCIEQALLEWRFPQHAARVEQTLVFRPHDGPAGTEPEPPPPPRVSRSTLVRPVGGEPYLGPYSRIRTLLERGELDTAWAEVWSWYAQAPGDVMALVALGEVAEARGLPRWAARAYGSIIDLHPSRAEMRRFAAARLESLRDERALVLAIDSYRKARDQRPDHPNGHRSLAFALLRHDDPKRAFDALANGLRHEYPDGRFLDVPRVLREDLGIVAAAWLRAQPSDEATIIERLAEHGVELARDPSLRFVLSWETDANDVDLHLFDGYGEHAFYEHPKLASGGELYADVTTGFGPECIGVTGRAPIYPYRLGVHYYARGPMGYGMGRVQVVRHDGAGRVQLEERPFVVMQDQAYVDLGEVVQPPGDRYSRSNAVPARNRRTPRR